MSGFSVESAALSEAALRVASVAPGVEEFREGALRHRHAAAGTRAAVGMSDLAEHWGAVLPHFAGAGDRLSEVLRTAAGDYSGVDMRIAEAAHGTGA